MESCADAGLTVEGDLSVVELDGAEGLGEADAVAAGLRRVVEMKNA